MSAAPEREASERRLIADYANQPWKDAGEPTDDALRYWLIAEAMLWEAGCLAKDTLFKTLKSAQPAAAAL